MNKDIEQRDRNGEDYRDKDISSITRLFQEIQEYRNSAEFMKKLEFYAGFPELAVYNAALVEQQRPGARLVLSIKDWGKLYSRKIKPNSRHVIILKPFSPVEFLFDIADTKPINEEFEEEREDNWVIENLILHHKKQDTIDTSFFLHNLRRNLPKFGITYTRFVVGSEINSEIRFVDRKDAEKLHIEIIKNHDVVYHNYFNISVNMYAEGTEELSLIIHELGHLFCQHIKCLWWYKRDPDKIDKEFEAETVSYLVCQRLGFYTNSIEYLADYVEANEEIPNIDINCVFEAVDIIEKMVKQNLDVTKCVMYRKDEDFKKIVDDKKAQIKKEQEAAKAIKQSL